MSSLQGRYDEEVEVYRHHLEQMYKLCRPCQAAVEHYIKHQNRQLRALLLSHQFKRREADQTYTQVRGASSPRVCVGDPFPGASDREQLFRARPFPWGSHLPVGPPADLCPSLEWSGVGGSQGERVSFVCVARVSGLPSRAWAPPSTSGDSSSAFIVGALRGTLETRFREVELLQRA